MDDNQDNDQEIIPVGFAKLIGIDFMSTDAKQFAVEWRQRLGRESSNREIANADSVEAP